MSDVLPGLAKKVLAKGELADSAVELTASCRWVKIGGRTVCPTHRQVGRRVGPGKLYRVKTNTGSLLVRASDPAAANAAPHNLVGLAVVERAQPHEGDTQDVIDARLAAASAGVLPP
jgi:hypothetical protein